MAEYRVIRVPDNIPVGVLYKGVYYGPLESPPPSPTIGDLWGYTNGNKGLYKYDGPSATPPWRQVDAAASVATVTTAGQVKTSVADTNPKAVITSDPAWITARDHPALTGNVHGLTSGHLASLGAVTQAVFDTHLNNPLSHEPYGTIAARPAPSVPDRRYWAYDEAKVYRDTGTAWELLVSRTWGDITGKPTTFAPASHAASHTSGADVISGLTDTHVAAANKNGVAATPSLRTLGTGALQAAAGDDSRLSNARAPSGAAGGDLFGTYPNPTLTGIAIPGYTPGTAVTNATVTVDAKNRVVGLSSGSQSGVPLASSTEEGLVRTSSNPPAGQPPVVLLASEYSPGSFATTARRVDTSAPLAGGGDLSADRSLSIQSATEAAQGSTRYATSAETQAGTLTTRSVHPLGLKTTMTPEAFTNATLANSWTSLGTTYDSAGYTKDIGNVVRLRGVVTGGVMTNATTLFTLPAGYRPAMDKQLASVCGTPIAPVRIIITSAGAVNLYNVTANNFLTLDGLTFRV